MGLNNSQKDKVSQLYHEMHDMLFSYANSVFKNKDLAEEAVQDTFRIACGKVESMLTSNNPRGWLVNTLKNVIRTTEYERATLNRLVVASLPSDDKSTHGFDGQKYAHTASKPLAIHKVLPAGFSFPERISAPAKLPAPDSDGFLCDFWFLRR